MTQETRIKYYLLIAANPLSDSKASIAVFKAISRLDILSRDVTVFLPGFHASKSLGRDSEEETRANINELENLNREKYEDYHGKNPVYHTYCESAGEMYFNDAKFSHIMLDLQDYCPNFNYYGRAELLVMPASKGKPLFEKVSSYNLEPFFDNQAAVRSSLEEFLMTTLKLIQKDDQRNSITLLEKINQLYEDLTRKSIKEDETEIVIRVDNQILEHMQWKDAEEIYFISYSTKDEFDAASLKYLLEKHGKHVWMAPDGIPAGMDYACVIPAAMRLTSRFVVLLSHNSAKSEWVRREIGKAVSYKKNVDGVFMDGFTIEDLNSYDHFGFLFETIQLRYNIKGLFDDKALLNEFINNQM